MRCRAASDTASALAARGVRSSSASSWSGTEAVPEPEPLTDAAPEPALEAA